MLSTLLTSLENGILTITINRPDKLNALNRKVMEELDEVVTMIYTDQKIQSAIICGAGNKAFVAGADISEFTGLSKEEGAELSVKGHYIFNRIEQSPKPIIAAVNGFALGGGCELAMACHFRIAAEGAKFGQPEVNLGLIPGYGGTQRLVQLIGKGRALELLLTGNMMDAQTALKTGLVNHVVPAEQLQETAVNILQLINSKAPLAVAACISTANAVFDESRNGFEVETNAFAACFGSQDMKEGTQAFLEKRKPVFTGN